MRLILFKSLPVSFVFVLFSCANKQSETHPVRKDLIESVYASVTILPKDVYKVNASISGYLDQINVAEGDAIIKGQLLFVISNEVIKLNERNAELNYEWVKDNLKGEANVLEDLKLSIYSAKVKQKNDSLNAERMKVLFSKNACSKFDMENAVTVSEFSTNTLLSLTNQLKRKQQELTNQLGQAHNNASASALRSGDYLIKSNQDGRVYQINKEQGELVSMQEPLAIIGKKDQFIVSMMVDEVDIGQIDLGQSVWVTLEAFPGKPFEAEITKISPKIDEKSQGFKIEAVFIHPPKRLYMGLSGEGNIVVRKIKNALVIPKAYLLPGNYVQTSNGKIKVKTGISNWDNIQILKGIDTKTTLILPE